MKRKRLLALGVFLVGVTAAAPLTAAQKPAPPQPTEQQKLKERVDALDSQLKEAQTRADRATFEKERIDKIQQHYEDYYEKVHNTEMHVLEAITAIFALFVGFAALFGFSVFDQRIQNAVSKATTDLETKFDQKLAAELKNLKDSNSAQMKQLEDDLVNRITDLDKDLKLMSDWQFLFLQGQASFADKRYDDALESFRSAIKHYKLGKPRHVIESSAGVTSISNVFQTLWRQNLENPDRDARAREELKSELYDGLEEELAQAALRNEWLGPLAKKRKQAAPPAPPDTAAPATAQESPTPAPDKTQPAKPEQGQNK